MLVWKFFEQLHGIFFSTIVCEFMKGSSPTPCVATSSWGCIHDRFIDTQFVLPVHFISGCGADFLRVLLSNPRFTLSYRDGGWLRVLLTAGGTTHLDSVVELHAFVYVILHRWPSANQWEISVPWCWFIELTAMFHWADSGGCAGWLHPCPDCLQLIITIVFSANYPWWFALTSSWR
jgi:hypothetical protein